MHHVACDCDERIEHEVSLVQERVGQGNERVRPPRLALEGSERAAALEAIDQALATRPQIEA